MSQPNYLPEVRNQYENYPYPAVDPALEKERLFMPVHESFDRLNYYCFEGTRDFRKNFRALVAGGGTGDAAIALADQLRGTEAEIIYLDMSEASMAIAKERAQVRGLTNIHWVRDSLLNLPKLGLGEMDYINCSGVLHHLANPQEGLNVLAASLKEDGAMGIMLYAKYGRMAVYQMQEMLRLLNKDEAHAQARVEHAKAILSKLPLTHWFHHSPPVIMKEVASGDAAIYDLLLHSQDRAYSIPELYAYVEASGLQLLHLFSEYSGIGNNLYNPAYYIKDARLLARAQSLSRREQQSLAELLHGKITRHIFYAAKTPRTPPSPENLDMIPVFGFDISGQREAICAAVRQAGPAVMLSDQANGISMVLSKTPHMELLFTYIDGQTCLRDMFRKIMETPTGKKQGANYLTLTAEFTALFRGLNMYDWLFLRGQTSSPVLYQDVLQARVKAL